MPKKPTFILTIWPHERVGLEAVRVVMVRVSTALKFEQVKKTPSSEGQSLAQP
jgi:hypothetical protein